MNYFGHGFRYLDSPWFLAGTALPDWLSVADRKVRLRSEVVEPFAAGEGPRAELAAGVLRHLEDDRWFHRNPVFVETTRQVAETFRDSVTRRDGHRLGFAAHLATEMLLDHSLIEEQPDRLDDYYSTLGRIDLERLERLVDAMAPVSTVRLVPFVRRFLEMEFLRDYGDDTRLLFRLNQVMGRVGLSDLPSELETAVRNARLLVGDRVHELLPPFSEATPGGERQHHGS